MRVRTVVVCLVFAAAALTVVIARALGTPQRITSVSPQMRTLVVTSGQNLLLDVPALRVETLFVDGRLTLADRDMTIEAERIVVRGRLQAGTAHHPFAHRLTILLDRDGAHGGNITALDGGTVELWGVPRLSWTHLIETAQPGADKISIATSTDWQRSDRIVLAPTGFAASEAEERAISSIDANRISLDAPLHYRHWGNVTNGVDERAEVGLLTHNIVIRNAHAGDNVGGQMLVLRGGTLRASGVEFFGLGEAGTKGKYPVHFHLADDQRASFVRGSSVVHSNNRCVVVHGSSGVTIADNVAYDTIGHCYFFEDGIEHGITLEHNLGLLTRAAQPNKAILDSDTLPATFWITNPANAVTDNVAAGSEGNGFWYDLSPHPSGPSATPNIWPRRTALGAFSRNVSHTNENDGLFVDILRNPPGVREAPNYDPPVPANFTHFLSYKNRRRGVWLRGTHLQLTQSLIADNSIGITFAGANDELLDSLVVGQTQNDTGPPKPFDPAFPLRGFEFYDGRVDVRDTTFENFLPNASRKASALSALQYTPFFTDPTNYAQHVTFIRSQPVYFTLHAGARDKLGADGYRSTVFVDTDGSVTGSPDASVVYDSPFLDDPDCKAVPQWNARVCNAQYASLFIVAPSSTKYVRVAQASRYAYVTLYGNPDRYARATFQTDVRADGAYIVTLSRASGTIEIAAHHLAKNATVTVYLPQAQEPAQRRLQLRDGERYRATVTSPRTGASL